MFKMKPAFFIPILAVWVLMIVYTITRGSQAFAQIPTLRWTYIGVLVLGFVSFFVGMFLDRFLPHAVAKPESFLGYSFLIFSAYLFFAFLLVDVVRIANHFFHFTPNFEKLRFWASLIVVSLVTIMMIIGHIKFNHPQVVHLNIESSKPLQNKLLKIVAVSDIHIGTSIDKSRLAKYVTLINAQQPDLVLIAGDLIDRAIKPVIDQDMDEELRQIVAPLGVYAVYGNHEYYGEDKNKTADFYKRSNITVLHDSVALIRDEIYVIGRVDRTDSKRASLESFIEDLDGINPRILLDHQPYNLQDAENNRIDLQFSGHTHNGQMFPGNLIVKKIFEQGYGYLKKGDTHYYVSSGLGLWGPQYRIGTQSELVVVDFKY
ncbi:MAG: metallophosphoesterase [Paludibacteraceae bacterium]